MFIDEGNFFTRNEKESETLIQTIRIFNQEFGI